MANGVLKHTDLVESGNPYDEATKGLIALIEENKKLDKELKKNVENLKKINPSTGKGIKQLNAEQKKSVQNTKQLVNLSKQEARARAQLSAAAKTQADTIAELKVQTQQQNAINKNLAKQNLAAAGSYDKLQAEMSENIRKFKQMKANTEAERKARQRLGQTINKQNDQLKKLDKTMGNSQRNVGNYADSIGEAAGQFGIFGGIMPRVGAGLKLLKAGFTSLRAAIISTGIGALVIAITALVQWFTKTASGAKILRKLMEPLKAIFATITNVVNQLGEGLFKIFSGDLAGGIRQITGAVSNLNDEYQRQLDIQRQLTILRNIEEKKYYEDTIRLAQLQRDIANQRKIANDDEYYSIQQQYVAINEAKRLTEEFYQVKINGAKRAVAAAVLEAAEAENSDEANRKLADTIAAVVQLEAQRDDNLRTILRRSGTLYRKLQTEQVQGQRDAVNEITTLDQLQTEELETQTEKRFKIEKRNEADIFAVKKAYFEKEKQLKEQLTEATIAESGKAAGAVAELLEQGSTEYKIFKTAEAIIATYTAGSKTLAEVPYPANIPAMISIIATGLANVAKINEVKFAEGTDYADDPRAPQGRDTIPAKIDRGEMILTRDEAGMVRQLGFGHADIPGIAYIGKTFQDISPRLAHLNELQLYQLINLNENVKDLPAQHYDKNGNFVKSNRKGSTKFVN